MKTPYDEDNQFFSGEHISVTPMLQEAYRKGYEAAPVVTVAEIADVCHKHIKLWAECPPTIKEELFKVDALGLLDALHALGIQRPSVVTVEAIQKVATEAIEGYLNEESMLKIA